MYRVVISSPSLTHDLPKRFSCEGGPVESVDCEGFTEDEGEAEIDCEGVGTCEVDGVGVITGVGVGEDEGVGATIFMRTPASQINFLPLFIHVYFLPL